MGSIHTSLKHVLKFLDVGHFKHVFFFFRICDINSAPIAKSLGAENVGRIYWNIWKVQDEVCVYIYIYIYIYEIYHFVGS
jgi:hypothetical protein